MVYYMSVPMYCLNDSLVDNDIALLRQAIRRFVIEAELTHSVDGYLINLGGLVFEVEDYGAFCKEYRAVCPPNFDLRNVFRKVLSCAEVINALSPLAGHVDDVKELVYSSPRHKSLRPYLDIIIEVLNRMPLSEKELEVMRPPISELERDPRTKPELGTYLSPYIPAETTDHSVVTRSKKRVIGRVLGYVSLTILLIGISYFSYALLVKYGLIEPLRWIPLP